MPEETIGQHLRRQGISRRDFVKMCGVFIGAMGLRFPPPLDESGLPVHLQNVRGFTSARQIAQALESKPRVPVIWLEFQDCAGCSEALTRSQSPTLVDLVLNTITVEYHETLSAAAGFQVEQAKEDAMKKYAGKYVLVVEGAIPRKDKGIYLKIAGKPGIEILQEVGEQAAAIIAIGSCASWGGIPSADPNPTGAVGVDAILSDKPIVNIPGCPANPYNLLATVLQYAIAGTLPELDSLRRPKFAYDRYIHDHCPRRPHFDAGEFVRQFGDYGHRQGWCMYHMGCKGPVTHAPCSTRQFNEVVDCWPIGIGAPCYGCTEQKVAFRVPMFETVKPADVAPPHTYAPIHAPEGHVSPVAAGVAGLIAGALLGAGYMASKKLGPSSAEDGPDSKAAGE